jgi:hypothetical protein
MGNGLKTEVYDTTALRKSNGVRTKDLLELYLPRFKTLKLPNMLRRILSSYGSLLLTRLSLQLHLRRLY